MSSFIANQTNSHLDIDSAANPSIFEVLAQQSLATGLRRASNYLKNILYSNNNQKFYFVFKYFDEIYLLFDICIQISHLQSFGASFSEHFYSLKRVRSESNSPLNRRQCLSSLVMLTLFPYLKSKIDILYEKIKLKQMVTQSGSDSINLDKLFVESYPLIRTVCRLVDLYYQISYTVGQNVYSSPLLRLSNVRLINLEDKDLREQNQHFETIDPNIDWFSYINRLSMNSTKILVKGFTIGLSVSAFFIQFLDYWYSSDNSSTNFAPLPIPPPPQKIEIEMSSELCPLCEKSRENDTALMTSGFVFCYSCITNYLKEKSQCPITGYPSTCEHLIKIYPPE